jgi:signal peptidase I
MNRFFLRVFCVMLIILAILDNSNLLAEIYKWTDNNGTVHFSDNPVNLPNNSQTIEQSPSRPSRRPPKNITPKPGTSMFNNPCAKPVTDKACINNVNQRFLLTLPPACRNRSSSGLPPKFDPVCDKDLVTRETQMHLRSERERCIQRWEIDTDCERQERNNRNDNLSEQQEVKYTAKRIKTVPSNQVYQFTIHSSNMEDSIKNGDKLTINKKPDNIKTKDIIAYKYPDDPSKTFIGRVIGLPGNTVKMVNKIVYINNLKLIEKYAVNKDGDIIDAKGNPRDNNGPITLASDEYFVLGDNRDRSYDCRFWSGSINKNGIIGKVIKINGRNVVAGKFK